MDLIKEFDSSDDEPESAKNPSQRLIDSVNVSSQAHAFTSNKDILPTESDNIDRRTLPLKESIASESMIDDNFIPLKVINVPSVVKDNMEVTLQWEQQNDDESNVRLSTKIDCENSMKKSGLGPNEDDDSQGQRDVEDEFGLDRESITHQQLMDLTSKSIASLIESDPLLSDLPSDVTLEEINSQIALVQGQSISVMVAASQPAKLVVAQEGTVLDLKRSLQRHTALRLARQGRSKVKVNWRYFWRTHWLVQPGGNRLTRDSDKLKDLGIVNKSVLTYCKRLHERQR